MCSVFFILLLYLVSFSGCLFSELIKYLQNECHLAAKFGTNFALYVFFAGDDFDLGAVLLSLSF